MKKILTILWFLLFSIFSANAAILGEVAMSSKALLRSIQPSCVNMVRAFSSMPPSLVDIRQERKTVRILAIDGGGIRSIIPLHILDRFETSLGRPIAHAFDIIAGTSSGGIAALALNRPKKGSENGQEHTPHYKAKEIYELYLENKDKIFTKTQSLSDSIKLPFPLKYLIKKSFPQIGTLLNSPNVFRAKYPLEPLKEVFETFFEDMPLSRSISTVVVPAYQIEHGRAYIFNSKTAKMDSTDDYYMRDVALATSCAPTYFPPAEVWSISASQLPEKARLAHTQCFVDGGIVANNPTLFGYSTARRLFPAATDFLIVSLGTGKGAVLKVPYDEVRKGGYAHWIHHIIPMLMNASTESVGRVMHDLMEALHLANPGAPFFPRHHDINPILPEHLVELDKASDENVKDLQGRADTTYRKLVEDKVIEKIVNELKEKRSYASGLDGNILVPEEDLQLR